MHLVIPLWPLSHARCFLFYTDNISSRPIGCFSVCLWKQNYIFKSISLICNYTVDWQSIFLLFFHLKKKKKYRKIFVKKYFLMCPFWAIFYYWFKHMHVGTHFSCLVLPDPMSVFVSLSVCQWLHDFFFTIFFFLI